MSTNAEQVFRSLYRGSGLPQGEFRAHYWEFFAQVRVLCLEMYAMGRTNKRKQMAECVSINDLRTKINAGYTDHEIAIEIGVDPQKIRLQRLRCGLKINKASRFKRRFAKKYGERSLGVLIKLRRNGCSLNEIRATLKPTLGATNQGISVMLKKIDMLGIKEA